MMLASLSKSTQKQYQTTLKQWCSFCEEEGLNLFDTTRSNILHFLTIKFKERASYGTLNSCRSALSLISKDKIGQDNMITRFLKSVYKLKPSVPKYSATWDVAIVLEYLSKLFPLERLALTELTMKTVTLLALCTGQRAQTLSKIEVNNIKFNTKGIRINVIDIIIRRRIQVDHNQCWSFPFSQKKMNYAIASTLNKYIEISASVRGEKQKLFLAIKKPHKEVNTQTISRWIESTLTKSGIDTSVFTAHSTRHALSSAAFRNGVNLEVIRKCAGWSKDSEMFAKVYNRSIEQNCEFARSILTTTQSVSL